MTVQGPFPVSRICKSVDDPLQMEVFGDINSAVGRALTVMARCTGTEAHPAVFDSVTRKTLSPLAAAADPN